MAGPCRDGAAAAGVQQALAAGVRCRESRLDGRSDPACDAPAPPRCSGTLVDDALALAYGGAGRSAGPPLATPAGPARACQSRLGAFVRDYTGAHLAARVAGSAAAEAAAEGRAQAGTLRPVCDALLPEPGAPTPLPSVGPQCEAALGMANGSLDAPGLEACLLTLLEVWVERVGPAPAPLRPNVIVVLSDDQRFDAVDALHGPAPGVPVMPATLARIAEQGVRFENSYVSWPVCETSRASLITGQYASRTHIDDFARFDESSTLAVWLQRAGYRTGYFGKYLFGYLRRIKERGLYIPPGWDVWSVLRHNRYLDYERIFGHALIRMGSSPADYSTDVLRDDAVAFVRSSAGQAPFFLIYAPLAPHTPPIPAPRHLGLFAGRTPWRPPSYDEADVSDKPPPIRRHPRLGATQIQREDQTEIDQLETLVAVDDAVAALLDEVAAQGAERDTLVIYTSDNGMLWGEHRLQGKKWPYEESVRVPALVRYPRLAPLPRSDAHPVVNTDIAATVLELAGAVADRDLDGLSWVRVLDGTARGWRGQLFLEGSRDGFQWRGMRAGDWKYVEYANGVRELYDLAADPSELDSLALDPAQAERVAFLSTLLRRGHPGTLPPAPPPPSPGGGGTAAPARCGLGAESAGAVLVLAWARRRRGGRRLRARS